MGNLTAIFSNHSLNTKSIEILAQQLSEKLHATVVYGYSANLEVEALQWAGDYRFVEQGVVAFPGAGEPFFLIDYYYLHRELLQHHPHQLKDWFTGLEFLLTEIEESHDCVTFELGTDDSFNDIVSIHQFVLEIDYLECIDWRSFTRFFSYASIEESIQYMQEWRKKHQVFISNLGGTEMIVYEDLAETFQEKARFKTTTFEQLKREAIELHPDDYCSISDFFIEKKYVGLPKYDDSPLTQKDFEKLRAGLPLVPRNLEKTYGIFWDDFRGI